MHACRYALSAPCALTTHTKRIPQTQSTNQSPKTGNDVGPQYASAIFYADESQEAAAKDALQAASALWPAPIVTKLLPLASDGPAKFWPAEEYHWDYYARNPGQGADWTGPDWNGLWSGSVDCLAQGGWAMAR